MRKKVRSNAGNGIFLPQRPPVQGSRAENQGLLKLDDVKVYVDPRVEWKHIFEQVWRLQQVFFYDPHLHGLDFEMVKRKYAPFLENIVTRDDLDYLIGEMLANLTVGHIWTAGPDANSKPVTTGLLGADYGVEQGRYRFVRIYESDPWSPACVCPLRHQERACKPANFCWRWMVVKCLHRSMCPVTLKKRPGGKLR